jgi:hypothetical protein
VLDGQYETAVLCLTANGADGRDRRGSSVAVARRLQRAQDESRRRATLPWLGGGDLPPATSTMVRDCRAAVLSPSDAWPSGLGWRTHSAHTCFVGVAERKVPVAMPSNNALKLTAPANRSAAA